VTTFHSPPSSLKVKICRALCICLHGVVLQTFSWSVIEHLTGLCWMSHSSTTRVLAWDPSQCTPRTQSLLWLQYGGYITTRDLSGDMHKL
jgi:hypothetical protein